VIIQRQLGGRRVTVSLLLDGDRLKVESHTVIVGANKESTVSELFDRIR
jgi:hypothetical protein